MNAVRACAMLLIASGLTAAAGDVSAKPNIFDAWQYLAQARLKAQAAEGWRETIVRSVDRKAGTLTVAPLASSASASAFIVVPVVDRSDLDLHRPGEKVQVRTIISNGRAILLHRHCD